MFVSDLLGDSGGALRVIGAISGQNETASLQINVFVSQDQIREDYIDLMAYGGNMYWLQPSEETTRPNWGEKGCVFVHTYSFLFLDASAGNAI